MTVHFPRQTMYGHIANPTAPAPEKMSITSGKTAVLSDILVRGNPCLAKKPWKTVAAQGGLVNVQKAVFFWRFHLGR